MSYPGHNLDRSQTLLYFVPQDSQLVLIISLAFSLPTQVPLQQTLNFNGFHN